MILAFFSSVESEFLFLFDEWEGGGEEDES